MAVDADKPDDDGYVCQVQGCMWITGRSWWDRVWYSGATNFPSKIVRVQRDDEFIQALSFAVMSFNSAMKAAKERLVAKGLRQVSKQQREDAAVDHWGLSSNEPVEAVAPF
jgi:hypothetical protein